MKEIWKDIPDNLGYQVSNLGRVRTFNKISRTQRHGDRKWKNRILKFKDQNYKIGYRVDLWENNKPKTFLVARLVAFTFYEKDITDLSLTVNHIDGNRFNNNLNNLELISLADNIRHAFATGLMSSCKKVILTDKQSNESQLFVSLSAASKAMGFNKGYLSYAILQGRTENKNHKWELLEIDRMDKNE